ncbi:hypothetical protein [Wielerella bovis]|uniref:hypothetical protein n=1 Tax=Wielerella bovis TaxID=2917790 RepID=UPI002019AB0E|nr:hypothetical protein [Wielerella bovis]ULJ65514.1 hypothetical protein MIS33_04430 [Wielerella bovis]ULJ66442.1 hypothetical protein MIS31_09275 [Wielerella bovis]ULJ70100.1 hypothetical protein MIS45_04565 [Wielerella bovis]
MKETLIGITSIILIVWAYLFMPLQWRRHKDIEHGDKLIAKVEQYRAQHFRLPENNETQVLEQLGFKKNKLGWQPAYQKQDADSYRIIYADGYAAPFLYWQSDEKKWALTAQ